MTHPAHTFFEDFDGTEDTLTLLTFDEESDTYIDEMLDYVQREKNAENEVIQDTYQDGYEKGYQEGIAAKEAEQLTGVNAIISAFNAALGDKTALTQSAQSAAVEMVACVIENCLPSLLDTNFLKGVESILFDIAQMAGDSVCFTLMIHPDDRAVLEDVLRSPKFDAYTITLSDNMTLARYSLEASWGAGGGAVFDAEKTTQSFLAVLKEMLTISS